MNDPVTVYIDLWAFRMFLTLIYVYVVTFFGIHIVGQLYKAWIRYFPDSGLDRSKEMWGEEKSVDSTK